MNLKSHAIVLKSTKYTDSSLIIKLFTKESGLQSYIVSFGKKNNTKATFQGLNLIEIESYQKGNNRLARIKTAKPHYHYSSISTNIYKTTVIQFLQEILNNSIQEETANMDLYEFIEAHLQYFDKNEKFNPNFHIYFLIKLTKYLGFYPQGIYKTGLQFNIIEGNYGYSTTASNYLDLHLSALLHLFTESSVTTNQDIKLNGSERRELLDGLVIYFQYHLDGFKEIKSIAVLETLFSD
jgi:DNA repair protein RecO (recombination protein O)